MKKMLQAVVFASVATMFVGCAGAKVLTNPDVQFPLTVNEQEPAFLFPVNLSHLGSGGDPTLMGVTVTGGVINKFGKTVVSGQQLFDLVGNLSFELAEAIQSQVRGKSWVMTGSAEPIATSLAQIMSSIIDKLVALKILDKPIKFKYIVALHSHGSSGMGGATLSVESWGGLYEVDTKKILSYIESVDTYANKPEAVMAQLPSAYNGIIEKLITGGVEPKK
jgi:hypothetical protein